MSNSTIEILQNNVKKYRNQKGITQLRLSVITGLSKDYIASIESKRRIPSIKRLLLIASALDVEIYKFFI
jgi:transcriptional regulator with XRE-family HTH domain